METTVSTNELLVQVQSAEEVNLTVVQPSTEINTVQSEEVRLTFTDVGLQGMPGAIGQRGVGIEYVWQDTKLGIKTEEEASYNFVELKGNTGNNLVFEDLTEQQKLELRGDVGSTSVNYANLFYDSLLS